MRYVLLAVLALGCRKATPDVRPDNKSAAEERVKCTIPDGDVASAVKVPARCDLTVQKNVRIVAGGSLDVGQGAKVMFARGTGLTVDGGSLVVRGTAASPVVFTSVESKRAPGDWTGITFAAKTGVIVTDAAPPSESSIEHAVVEFACVRVGSDASLAHVKIRESGTFGLFVANEENVKKLEAVTFEGNKGALDAPPAVVALLGGDPGDVVKLHGSVKSAVTLPKLAAHYLADSLSIVSPGALTVPDGATVKFLAESGLSLLGRGGTGAALVAHHVTFTAAADKPAAGAWRGFHVMGDAAIDFDDVVVEYAGCSSKKCAAIRMFNDKKVKVTNSTFRNNPAAAFEFIFIGGSGALCAKWNDPALKNKSIGQPMCEEPPELKLLGALGSLGSKGSPSSVWGSGKSDLGEIGLIGTGASIAGPGSGDFGGGGIGIGAIGGGGGTTKVSTVTETSITAAGGLPADVVRKVVRSRTSALRACHARGDDSGSITVTFAIDAKGSVATASASSFPSADVTSCVTAIFRGMKFPESESGTATSATATHKYSF